MSNLNDLTGKELMVDELKLADIICHDSDLTNVVPNTKEYTLNSAGYGKEYHTEMNTLILKSTIVNYILLILDIEDSDDKTILHALYGSFRNLIILHGRDLSQMPKFTDELKIRILSLKSTWDRNIIFKMIHNIQSNKYCNNIDFRDIHINSGALPPISAEDRIIIEKTLPQYTHMRHIKKTPNPFNIGEIVGAKDKEHKWWLSRILHRYENKESADYWYYIRFENQNSIHDEWINSNTYRVRKFNPKKHFLKERSSN